MTPITQNEVAEMKKHGADAKSIREAEERLWLTEHAGRIADKIRLAFKGVTLGNGVGLEEAQGLDDYADEATLEKYRASDEKLDWEKISSAELNRCYTSLHFFDAEGMRFHLPAYLIADLKGEFVYGMAFCLSDLNDYNVSRFTLLNREQRLCIRAYLLHILSDSEYHMERPHIERALQDYWKEE